MYGLRQAVRLAWVALLKNLTADGYRPDRFCTNIWRHNTRQTKFCLWVDDFGVKYYSKQDANHLINSLQKHYDITIDHKGENFCGLIIEWNYKARHIDISIRNYVIKRYIDYNIPSLLNHNIHLTTVPIYVTNRQYSPDPDTLPLLSPKDIKRVQSVVGTFLYYTIAIDNTISPALNKISVSQAKPIQQTEEK